MNNIIITSDSTTDLGEKLRFRYNIDILPLGIVLDDKMYKDGIEITPTDIYEHHKNTGKLPKTVAPNIDQCIQFFKKYSDSGKTVIHFTISSLMSSSYSNSVVASKENDNVYVVDTKNLSSGGGLLVLAAAEMAEKGMEADKIIEEINKLVPRVDASFVIDNLEYLYKGGRCSALAFLGANLLKLKPCIEVKNGAMDVGKKYRGKYEEVLKQYIKERIEDYSDIMLDRVFITHAGCDPQLAEDMVNYVKKLVPFNEVFLTTASCTVSSHCGANTLGVLFIRKSPIL